MKKGSLLTSWIKSCAAHALEHPRFVEELNLLQVPGKARASAAPECISSASDSVQPSAHFPNFRVLAGSRPCTNPSLPAARLRWRRRAEDDGGTTAVGQQPLDSPESTGSTVPHSRPEATRLADGGEPRDGTFLSAKTWHCW